MSTTRSSTGAALGAVDDEPCRLPADRRCRRCERCVSAGCVSAANSRSPKPNTASRPGTGDARAPAPRSSTPSASTSELQKTASMSGRRASRSASALRPLPSVVGAGTTTGRHSPRPRRAAAGRSSRGARPARASSAGDDGEPAPALRVEVLRHRAPDLLMGETDQHVDRRRRQIPGLDHRDAGARAGAGGPPAECMIPVSTMPSGRRPMIASSSASSRELAYPALARASAGSPTRRARPSATGSSRRKTGPAIVGTTAATSRLRVEARPPASMFGT